MAVKGSGGDLASIGASGFAVLYMDKLNDLVGRYRGEAHEDEMVGYYPLCAFGENRVAASIDTALHAFLPFPHVDHLHPDWAIALAASANGQQKLDEFNKKYGRRIAWVPWQRPGFELALMLRKAVEANPGCDGIVLGGHGLFTWGETQEEAYLSSIKTIDQMGEFVQDHGQRAGSPLFGGATAKTATNRAALVNGILPYLRGAVSSNRRVIAHYDGGEDAIAFANAKWAESLCQMGTSCPDHFLRTRISPLYVPFDAATDALPALKTRIARAAGAVSSGLRHLLQSACAPGFAGAARFESLGRRDSRARPLRLRQGQAGSADHARSSSSTRFTSCRARTRSAPRRRTRRRVRLPRRGIPDRRPTSRASRTTSRCRGPRPSRSSTGRSRKPSSSACRPSANSAGRSSWSSAARSGIGREVALQIAKRGGHVVVADMNVASAEEAAKEAAALSSKEMVLATALDLTSRDSIAAAFRATVDSLRRHRRDCQHRGHLSDAGAGHAAGGVWAKAMHVNVTSNYVLADEAAKILKDQGLAASIVLTSSANAVVPKFGSEPYDVSKAAINHLIRELAMGLGPLVRVNGIAPATVVAGSAMFPRDRVMVVAEEIRDRVRRIGVDREPQIEARRVLRAADDHAPADPAGGLRQRDLLAGRRPERQDDRARDPGRWGVAGSVPAIAYRVRSR